MELPAMSSFMASPDRLQDRGKMKRIKGYLEAALNGIIIEILFFILLYCGIFS